MSVAETGVWNVCIAFSRVMTSMSGPAVSTTSASKRAGALLVHAHGRATSSELARQSLHLDAVLLLEGGHLRAHVGDRSPTNRA